MRASRAFFLGKLGLLHLSVMWSVDPQMLQVPSGFLTFRRQHAANLSRFDCVQ
jgi:hypothetical protein